jgi:copper chaperone NosL
MKTTAICLLAGVVLVLGACNEEVSAPQPAHLTRAAIGHYCNMIVADHPGPKIQIHENGKGEPKWFSSVRDGLAYLVLPGEAHKVTAVYVHDMGRAASWDEPQSQAIWIDANQAFFVIDSSMRGGMGAMEAVPFLERGQAEAFAAQHGGKVLTLTQIPHDYIVGDRSDHPAEPDAEADHGKHGS